MFKRIQLPLLLAVVALILSSYIPYFQVASAEAGYVFGGVLSRYITVGFAALLLIVLPNKNGIAQSSVIKTMLWLLVWMVISAVALSAIYQVNMMRDIISIGMCVGGIIIGWKMRMGENQYNVILLVYMLFSLLVGLLQVFQNVGGLIIEDQYLTEGKNAYGTYLATSIVLSVGLLMTKGERVRMRWIYIVVIVLSLISLLVARARTATLAGVVVALYMWWCEHRKKKFLQHFLMGLFVLIVVFVLLPSGVKQFVLDSFTQGHAQEDITSGRTERNIFTINFLLQHPVLGNLEEKVQAEWVHNYILYKWFSYGLIFFLPMLVMYFYLLIRTIKGTMRYAVAHPRNFGYFAMLVPFFISLAEPVQPFAPGTAVVSNYIFLGLALRNTYEQEIEKKLC